MKRKIMPGCIALILFIILLSLSPGGVTYSQSYPYYALFKIVGTNFSIKVTYYYEGTVYVNRTHYFSSQLSNSLPLILYIRYWYEICTENSCNITVPATYFGGAYLEIFYENSTFTETWYVLDSSGVIIDGGYISSFPVRCAIIEWSGDLVPLKIVGFNSTSCIVDSGSISLGGIARSYSIYGLCPLLMILIFSLLFLIRFFSHKIRR